MRSLSTVILAIIGVLWFLGWLIRMRRARSVAANRPTVLKEALERARHKQREPPRRDARAT